MVRGFALLLVLGIVVAFALALTVGLARPVPARPRRAGSGGGTRRPVRAHATRRRSPAPGVARRPSRSPSRGPAVGARCRAAGRRALAFSIAAPGRVLAVAAVLAVVGWGVGTRIPVISDIRELVPRNLPALQNVDELEQATGVSGLTYVTVTAPDLTRSEGDLVDARLRAARSRTPRVQRRGTPSCRAPRTEICPEISLPDFLYGDRDGRPSRQRIKADLRLLPAVRRRRRSSRPTRPTGKPGNTGVITFGIKVMPFDQQKRLIDDIRAQIDPPGTGERPARRASAPQVLGLPVLAADANSSLSGQPLPGHDRRAARGRARPGRRLPLGAAERWCR